MYIICKKRRVIFNITEDKLSDIPPNHLYEIINNPSSSIIEIQDLEYPYDVYRMISIVKDDKIIKFNTLIDYIIYLLDSLSISA